MEKEKSVQLSTKTKLLRIIGHDLKNPINCVVSFINILEGTRLDPKLKNEINIVKNNAARTYALLESMQYWLCLEEYKKLNIKKHLIKDILNKSIYVVYDSNNISTEKIKNKISYQLYCYCDFQLVHICVNNILAFVCDNSNSDIYISSIDSVPSIGILIETQINPETCNLTPKAYSNSYNIDSFSALDKEIQLCFEILKFSNIPFKLTVGSCGEFELLINLNKTIGCEKYIA
ncbi:MAG: hypothetical protein N4A49_16220 [Marinifilaceae bacterium]|jgi:light-regulated signal transduction histidine kinase (bacteriophytochrome)|nr:hypothetical protein [Marinifilaceae bacterium]